MSTPYCTMNDRLQACYKPIHLFSCNYWGMSKRRAGEINQVQSTGHSHYKDISLFLPLQAETVLCTLLNHQTLLTSQPVFFLHFNHSHVTYSEPTEPSSSDWLVSSSDWSLRRSQGRMAEESAISRTGAMLGLRLPAPFSVGKDSLLLSSGGSGFWRSMATVPENDIRLQVWAAHYTAI